MRIIPKNAIKKNNMIKLIYNNQYKRVKIYILHNYVWVEDSTIEDVNLSYTTYTYEFLKHEDGYLKNRYQFPIQNSIIYHEFR